MSQPKIYIVLVNFNDHENTIETIESLAKQSYKNFQVVVVDNNTPASLLIIKEWAEGSRTVNFNPPHEIEKFSMPYCNKPAAWISYTVEEAEKGGVQVQEKALEEQIAIDATAPFKYPLIFVQAKSDIGFAGGNNVGSRYALKKGDADFVWLLNNDTTLDFDALKYLVEKAVHYASQGEKVGMIVSKLRWYKWPDKINAIGGKFNKWTTWSYHLGVREVDNGQYDNDDLKFDCVYGASIFIRKEFLEEVGLMNEVYYAYFEEMDWEVRGVRKGWKHGYQYKSANMALLDAMALTLALRTRPVDEAPAEYARMRRWHVRAYQAMSAAFTPMYQSDSRLLPPLRDHLLAPLSRLPVVRQILTALVSGDMIPPIASTRWP